MHKIIWNRDGDTVYIGVTNQGNGECEHDDKIGGELKSAPLVASPASSAWKCWSYGLGGTAPLTLGRAGEYIKSPLINTDVYQLQLFVVLTNPIYL